MAEVDYKAKYDEAQAENERLKAELERLKPFIAPPGFEWIPLSVSALVCGAQAYHLLGGFGGMIPPELPNSLSSPDGTMWVAHADTRKRTVTMEAKRHWLRQDIPRETETMRFPRDSFATCYVLGERVTTFSVDGVYKAGPTSEMFVADLLAMAGKDPDDYFLCRIDAEGTPLQCGEVDTVVQIVNGDRFVTQAVKPPEAEVAEEEEPALA